MDVHVRGVFFVFTTMQHQTTSLMSSIIPLPQQQCTISNSLKVELRNYLTLHEHLTKSLGIDLRVLQVVLPPIHSVNLFPAISLPYPFQCCEIDNSVTTALWFLSLQIVEVPGHAHQNSRFGNDMSEVTEPDKVPL